MMILIIRFNQTWALDSKGLPIYLWEWGSFVQHKIRWQLHNFFFSNACATVVRLRRIAYRCICRTQGGLDIILNKRVSPSIFLAPGRRVSFLAWQMGTTKLTWQLHRFSVRSNCLSVLVSFLGMQGWLGIIYGQTNHQAYKNCTISHSDWGSSVSTAAVRLRCGCQSYCPVSDLFVIVFSLFVLLT